MVWPTNSGKMVERRDQVFTTFLSLAAFRTSIFTLRCASTNGPFLVERAIKTLLLALGFLLLAARDDKRVGPLVVARLVSACWLAPRGHRVTAARGLAFAAAVRMVDRVHGYAAVGGTNAQPAGAPGLADRNVLVIGVAHLAHGRHALHQDPARLARRQL